MQSMVVRVSLRPVLALGLFALLGAGASAQITTRTFRTDPAVIESTHNVFPQINESYSARPMKPANPKLPLPVGADNGLRVSGTNDGGHRVQTQARFPGINATGWNPPDCTMAAGPNHVVATVNVAVAFFNKSTGAKTFQQDLGASGFFASLNPSNFVFDPKVFYDHINRRFVIVAPELDQGNQVSKILVAVSDDADPNGNWNKYRIEAKVTANGQEHWLDYPGFGFNKDAYVVTGNMFGFGNSWAGAQFIILPSAPLMSGNSANVTSIVDGAEASVQVCQTMDSTSNKIYAVSIASTNSARMFCITNLTSNPQIQKASVSVPAFQRAGRATSRNGAQLDTLGDRVLNASFRNNRVLTAHSASVPSEQRAQVRWYEFNVQNWPGAGRPTLAQSGDVRPPSGESYFMPAIHSNRLGDIALIFSRASANVSADVMVTGRKAADPLGQMGVPRSLGFSAGAYGGGGHRWGDYFACVTDPNDDSTFWGIGQVIMANGAWSTEIPKWTISSGGNPNDVVLAQSATMRVGTGVQGTLADIQRPDERYFMVGSTMTSGLGQVSEVEVNFRIARPVSQLQGFDVYIENVASIANITGMAWIYNWQTGRMDFQRSVNLPASGQGAMTISITNNLSRYVKADGSVRVVLRGNSPIPVGGSPRTFTLRTDCVQLFLNAISP